MFDRFSRIFGFGAPRMAPPSQRLSVPAEHPLRPVLDSRYLEMRAAMASGNAAAIAQLLTSDFTSIDVRGKTIGAEAMISMVLSLNVDRSKRSVQTVIVDVVDGGDEASVQQQYTMISAKDAPWSMPRSLFTFSHDKWKKVRGEWLLSRTETQEIEIVSRLGIRSHLVKPQPRS
jgi:hypothetical protein